MNLLRSSVVIAIHLLGFSGGFAGAGSAHAWGIDPAAFQRIDEICRALVDDGHTPGLVVTVGRCRENGAGATLYEKAYGSRDGTVPSTVDTLYDLASVTKPTCTAMAALLLIQDGKLSLDDTAAEWIPAFDRDGKREIRIRHLLTHTSGLPSYTGTSDLPPRPNADALIDRIGGLALRNPIGEKVLYSCLNYIVLARIVENCAGRNLDAFLRSRLWDRIGMKDTTFFPSPEQIARTAPTVANPARRGRVHDPLAWYSIDYDAQTRACGNAGGFSTAADMGRLARLILCGALDGATILTPETAALITTQQTDAGRRTHGWSIYREGSFANPANSEAGQHCIGHTGYTGTHVWLDTRSRTYVVLLANSVYPHDDPANRRAIERGRARIVRTVLDHLDEYADAASGSPLPTTPADTVGGGQTP